MSTWLALLVGFIPGAAAAVLGWAKWLHEIRERRSDKVRLKTAEDELAAIRRRGSGPFLAVDLTTINQVYFPQVNASEVPFRSAENGNLLCFCREEVQKDAPVGIDIALVIKNVGEQARKCRISMNGRRIELAAEPDFGDAHGLLTLRYDYNPARHGEDEIISLWFEAESGVQDTHKYRMRHGFRALERIDPA